MSPPRIQFYNRQKEFSLYLRKLAPLLRRAVKHLPAGAAPLPGEIEISFLSRREMSRVHAEFLGDPSLTDVITFQHGEILICPRVAHEQARSHGQTFQHELLLYGIHGLLHLLGWNDVTPAQARRMAREQERILSLVLAQK